MKATTQYRIWFINYFTAPFSWSKWCDIQTFSFGRDAYLLQGRVNARSNAKKFRVTSTNTLFQVQNVGSLPMEKLKDRGLINDQVEYNK